MDHFLLVPSFQPLYVRSPVVDGPIQLIVLTERTAQDIFKYSSLSKIQPVQLKIQQPIVNRSNYGVHVIGKVPPLVQLDSTYRYNQ